MVDYLTKTDRDNLYDLYEGRFSSYGVSHKTVGWGSKKDQLLRFDILCRGLELKGKSILDVGCGLGDLVPYLEMHYGSEFEYLGLDIADSLINQARYMYKKNNVNFICSEMTEFSTNENFDIVISSGALSFKVNDNVTFAQKMITRFFEISNEVLAVNFLTSYVDYMEDKNFHYSPEKMFSFSRSLTKRVVLYHDYPLWEFTLQLKK